MVVCTCVINKSYRGAVMMEKNIRLKFVKTCVHCIYDLTECSILC